MLPVVASIQLSIARAMSILLALIPPGTGETRVSESARPRGVNDIELFAIHGARLRRQIKCSEEMTQRARGPLMEGASAARGWEKKKAILEGVGLSGVSRQNMKNGSGEANREKCHVDQFGWTFFFFSSKGWNGNGELWSL